MTRLQRLQARQGTRCEDPAAHEAHMEMNGECPWCGAADPDQTEFGTITVGRMSPQERVDAEATVAFYRARGGSKFTALTTTLIRLRDAYGAPLIGDTLTARRAHRNAVRVAAESFGFVTRAQYLKEARLRGLGEAWFWEQGLMADLDAFRWAA